MIGKFIHELLLENEIVIIPGFGAFISNYKSAEINEETDELKPPSKEISFNPQIRNNDGLLVGTIAEGEGVSHFDALKKIEKERENIIFQLDKRERVVLEETGELYVNENNEIQFKPFEDENLLLDSFGLDPISLKKEVKKKEEVESPNEIIVPEMDEPPKEEPAIEPEKEEPEPIVVQELEKEIQEPQIQQTKSPKEEPVSTPVYEDRSENEKKKKRSGLWLLLILLPIVIVGIYIKNQKSKTEKQTTDKNIESTLTIKEEPFLVADSIPVEVPDSTFTGEIVIDSTETIILDSPKYYLVGGSFKEEKNAENYLKQLKEEGLEPFHLGKRGNFYVVGIGTYETELAAVSAKQEFVKKNPDSGVWVMVEN